MSRTFQERLCLAFVLPALLIACVEHDGELLRCHYDHILRSSCCCPAWGTQNEQPTFGAPRDNCCDVQTVRVDSSPGEAQVLVLVVNAPVGEIGLRVAAALPLLRPVEPATCGEVADANPPIILRNCSLLI